MNIQWNGIIIAALVLVTGLHAQEHAGRGVGEGSVSIAPLYQHWSVGDTLDINELSTVIDVRYPVTSALSVYLRSVPLTAETQYGGGSSGQSAASQTVSGLNDTQFGASYFLEKSNLAFTLGINLPTGQRELSLDEFLIGLMLSNRVFAFQSPHLGQGLKIHPAVLWAVPINSDIAAGFGAAYQYRGEYTPIADLGAYDPGDEILAIAGIDIRTGDASVASFDVSYTHFGTDQLDGYDIFEYGDRISVDAQYRTAFGHDALWVFGRYRFKTESKLVSGYYVVPADTRLEPNNAELLVHYGWNLSRETTIGIRAEGRLYESTGTDLSGITLFGGWLMPEFTFGSLSIPVRAGYMTGSGKDGLTLMSWQAGAGIRWNFM